MSTRMSTINLQSSDSKVISVETDIARQSVVLRTLLDHLGNEKTEDEVIPLPTVNAAILCKVIQWCTHHKDDALDLEKGKNEGSRRDDISSWDRDFLKVDYETLFQLILAANFLDIKGLLDLTCKSVANMITEKNPLELRRMFHIKMFNSDDAEEQVCKEGEWCVES